jgi:hypothetical protein
MAADMAATAADVDAATTATASECAGRRHGAAESESHCKNDHHLTQHDKPPLRMFFCISLIDKPTLANKNPRQGRGYRDRRKSEQFVTTHNRECPRFCNGKGYAPLKKIRACPDSNGTGRDLKPCAETIAIKCVHTIRRKKSPSAALGFTEISNHLWLRQ